MIRTVCFVHWWWQIDLKTLETMDRNGCGKKQQRVSRISRTRSKQDDGKRKKGRRDDVWSFCLPSLFGGLDWNGPGSSAMSLSIQSPSCLLLLSCLANGIQEWEEKVASNSINFCRLNRGFKGFRWWERAAGETLTTAWMGQRNEQGRTIVRIDGPKHFWNLMKWM